MFLCLLRWKNSIDVSQRALGGQSTKDYINGKGSIAHGAVVGAFSGSIQAKDHVAAFIKHFRVFINGNTAEGTLHGGLSQYGVIGGLGQIGSEVFLTEVGIFTVLSIGGEISTGLEESWSARPSRVSAEIR